MLDEQSVAWALSSRATQGRCLKTDIPYTRQECVWVRMKKWCTTMEKVKKRNGTVE